MENIKYKLTSQGQESGRTYLSGIRGLSRTILMELLYGPEDTTSVADLEPSSPFTAGLYKEAFEELEKQGYIMKDPETQGG